MKDYFRAFELLHLVRTADSYFVNVTSFPTVKSRWSDVKNTVVSKLRTLL